MIVVEVLRVKSRGTVIVVTDIPKGLRVGCRLRQGERAWEACGVEMMNPPRITERIGVLVKGLNTSEDPKEGPIELEVDIEAARAKAKEHSGGLGDRKQCWHGLAPLVLALCDELELLRKETRCDFCGERLGRGFCEIHDNDD